MKDYPYMPGWRQNKENNKPAINHSVLMLSKYGVSEGEWDGNEWIQYRWSGKFKDSDVLYWIHLEDLQQLEKEGENIQQEQPEVELNEETIINEFRVIRDKCFIEGFEGWQREKLIARHFYELGLNARKK